MRHKVAIIGNRAFPASFSGTSGIEYYTEKIVQKLSFKHDFDIYVKNIYQQNSGLKFHRARKIISLPTINSKVFESVIYSLLASIHASLGESDVVWYHGVGQAFFSFIPRLFKKKVIITLHGEDWKRTKWSLLEQTLFSLLAKVVFYLNKQDIFVVSKKAQKQIFDNYSIVANIAYPGMNIGQKSKITRRQESKILKKYNLKKNQFFLYLGRIVPEKRLDLFLGIDESSLQEGFKVVIAGRSKNPRKYESAFIDQIASNTVVKVLDYVFGDEKTALIQNARALILPSELEGNSISVIEALSFRTPVLVRSSCVDVSLEVESGLHTFDTNSDFLRMIKQLKFGKRPLVKISKETLKLYSWDRTAQLYHRAITRGK